MGFSRRAGKREESCVVSWLCGDVTRSSGLIFAWCWRADGTVKGSSNNVGRKEMVVRIGGRG